VSQGDAPQAAVVGFIVTDDFEIFFDTVDTSRKVPNLRRNPRVAFVVGGTMSGDERTVQYEGVADEPAAPVKK
jgi:general stress protein 26